jgi:hypothetical protein
MKTARKPAKIVAIGNFSLRIGKFPAWVLKNIRIFAAFLVLV